MRATAIQAGNAMPTGFRPAKRPRSGTEIYVAGLHAKLSIEPHQTEAWRVFADTLSANVRRMQSDIDHSHEPLGHSPIDWRTWLR
jgi:hypothetical protein